MKIYVVRHGQTVTNTKHIVNGQKESPLTLKGKMQAVKVRDKLKNIKFDIVLSSPLNRALDTAKIITNKKIHIDKRLIERNYGIFEGKPKNSFDYKIYWNYNKNLKDNNIESVQELFKRVEKLLESLKDYNIVLLVTHSAVARAIHYYINGIPQDGDLTPLNIPNCTINIYEMRGKE